MEYLTPGFTKEMMKDYTLLIPNMCPIQFRLIRAALESEGFYRVELLGSSSSEVTQQGLRYVHNDTCYPALIIIGQFLEALRSGKYDLHKTALVISQTGGGCRASNYIRLLRKALVRSGYDYIPVASFNAMGMENGSTLPMTPKSFMKLAAAVFYGDEIFALRNQVHAYEKNSGDAERTAETWLNTIDGWFREDKNYLMTSFPKVFRKIARDFAVIPMDRSEKKVRVGVVGEIYVKFSPTGNNNLLEFLEGEGCEVNMPGLLGYIEYCCANWKMDSDLYGISPRFGFLAGLALKIMDHYGKQMSEAMKDCGFYAPDSFFELMKKPEGILDLGTKMGEGWLLTAEMVELIEGGLGNIICAQPFGCLPNHIAGKGVVSRIRERFPEANITPVDYDPSATRVNQENRIRLMLAVAKENMGK
ncbi:MAG: 2-hydroxyacyl-CoA dehydratase [Solobacterium sp.]|nr:2-hydroxyacyl-CoA dehydratase [Solobacterium sp.]